MARIHFFQVDAAWDESECNIARDIIEKALTLNGCPNDKVIVTNFEYQGSIYIQDEFAMPKGWSK